MNEVVLRGSNKKTGREQEMERERGRRGVGEREWWREGEGERGRLYSLLFLQATMRDGVPPLPTYIPTYLPTSQSAAQRHPSIERTGDWAIGPTSTPTQPH